MKYIFRIDRDTGSGYVVVKVFKNSPLTQLCGMFSDRTEMVRILNAIIDSHKGKVRGKFEYMGEK